MLRGIYGPIDRHAIAMWNARNRLSKTEYYNYPFMNPVNNTILKSVLLKEGNLNEKVVD